MSSQSLKSASKPSHSRIKVGTRVTEKKGSKRSSSGLDIPSSVENKLALSGLDYSACRTGVVISCATENMFSVLFDGDQEECPQSSSSLVCSDSIIPNLSKVPFPDQGLPANSSEPVATSSSSAPQNPAPKIPAASGKKKTPPSATSSFFFLI